MALHPNGLEAVAVEVHGFLQVQVGRAYGTQRVTFHGGEMERDEAARGGLTVGYAVVGHGVLLMHRQVYLHVHLLQIRHLFGCLGLLVGHDRREPVFAGHLVCPTVHDGLTTLPSVDVGTSPVAGCQQQSRSHHGSESGELSCLMLHCCQFFVRCCLLCWSPMMSFLPP